MKDFCENIDEIPSSLIGTCYSSVSLCLFCQGKIDEYKKNPFCIWDELPTGCKMAGWIFLKKEEVKQKIRRKKEKILSLKIKSENLNGIMKKRMQKDIMRYQKEVDVYKTQGSYSW